MALGAIVNVNNADLPEDFDATMNVRYVYRPHFEPLDLERKFGNLTLTYAMQIHACVVEIDPETGVYEVVDYAVIDDCGTRINPQIVEGQVMGAHGARARRGDLGDVRLRRGGQPPDARTSTTTTCRTRSTCRRSRRARSSRRRRSRRSARRAWARAAAPAIHAVCAALQDALKTVGGAIIHDSHNPYHRVFSILQDPAATRADVKVESA